MPRELLGKIDLDLLFPPFLEKVLEVLAACKARGALYVPYFGYRSNAEQLKLYRAWKAGKGGRAAPPGLSAHNYGLAVDVYRQGNAGQALWLPKLYTEWGEEARRHGLDWGARYSDRPHVNLWGYSSADELEVLRQVWNHALGTDLARLKAVWQYLGAHPKQQKG